MIDQQIIEFNAIFIEIKCNDSKFEKLVGYEIICSMTSFNPFHFNNLKNSNSAKRKALYQDMQIEFSTYYKNLIRKEFSIELCDFKLIDVSAQAKSTLNCIKLEFSNYQSVRFDSTTIQKRIYNHPLYTPL